MRTKEDAHDYRYFPDPDLLPLAVTEEWVAAIRSQMPELPEAKRARLREQHALPVQDTVTLTLTRGMAEYFDEAIADAAGFASPKEVANWLTGDLSAKLNETGKDASESPVRPSELVGLLSRIHDGTISNKIAKEVFEAMWNGEGTADAVITARGLKQISDAGALEGIVAEVLAANPKQVDDYRAGKEKAFNSLVGQVMKATQGKANPAQVNALLRKKLTGVSGSRGARCDAARRGGARSRGLLLRRDRRAGLGDLAIAAQIVVVPRVDRVDFLLLLLDQLGVGPQLDLVLLDLLLELRRHRPLRVELGLRGEGLLALPGLGQLALGVLNRVFVRLYRAIARIVDVLLARIGVEQRLVLAPLLLRGDLVFEPALALGFPRSDLLGGGSCFVPLHHHALSAQLFVRLAGLLGRHLVRVDRPARRRVGVLVELLCDRRRGETRRAEEERECT